MYILPHQPHTRYLYGLFYQGLFPTLLPKPPGRLPRNPPSDPMAKHLQHLHHCFRDHPTLAPVHYHCMYHLLVHHWSRPQRCPRLLQQLQHHAPPPPCLPHIVIQGCPFAIVVRDGAAQVGKCGRWLQGVQVNFYWHLADLETPLQYFFFI